MLVTIPSLTPGFVESDHQRSGHHERKDCTQLLAHSAQVTGAVFDDLAIGSLTFRHRGCGGIAGGSHARSLRRLSSSWPKDTRLNASKARVSRDQYLVLALRAGAANDPQRNATAAPLSHYRK